MLQPAAKFVHEIPLVVASLVKQPLPYLVLQPEHVAVVTLQAVDGALATDVAASVMLGASGHVEIVATGRQEKLVVVAVEFEPVEELADVAGVSFANHALLVDLPVVAQLQAFQKWLILLSLVVEGTAVAVVVSSEIPLMPEQLGALAAAVVAALVATLAAIHEQHVGILGLVASVLPYPVVDSPALLVVAVAHTGKHSAVRVAHHMWDWLQELNFHLHTGNHILLLQWQAEWHHCDFLPSFQTLLKRHYHCLDWPGWM